MRSLRRGIASTSCSLVLAAAVAACGGGDTTGVDRDDTPPAATIGSPSDGATFVEGETATFEGSADDDEDGSLNGDALTWESDRDGELGTGTRVERDDLSVGEHTVTLSATDQAGNTGSASVAITVEENDPPSASIAAPSQDTTAAEGAPVDLEGSATDPQSGDLAGSSLTWSSDQDGELGTGEQIAPTDLSVATHTIELVAEDPQGLADTASVSITIEQNGQPTATIDAPSDGAEFDEGQEITFQGSGSDPEDGTLTGESLTWESDVDGTLGTGETVTRDDLSAGSHTITLTATDSERAPTSTSIGIDVEGDPTAGISQPSDQSIFAEGEAVTLEGSATDPTEGALGGSSLEWSSDVDGTLGTGETLTATDLSAGPHTITLTATDSDGNTGTASVRVLLEAPGFDIRLRFIDDFTASEEATIRDALDPWLQAITGDLAPAFPSEEQATNCGTGTDGIDDMVVVVLVADIDGQGGALAQARPCLARTNSAGDFTTSISGVVFIDDADRDNAQLEQIMTHEVGHALGIGIGALQGWGDNANTTDSQDPFFTGTSALSAFENDLAGQAYLSDGVPLANTGGQGTAGAHWREENFETELMTGFINSGLPNPLSVVSLASLEDIGYQVDLSTADDYDLPMPQLALLEPEADARLSRPASSDVNSGDGAFVVGSNNGQLWSSDPESEAFTSLVRFDVPSLPSGVDLVGATLTLFVQEVDDETTGHDVEVLEVTETWSEGTVTWDDRPAFGGSPLLTYPFNAADPTLSSADLTSLIRGWIDGSTTNHGLALDAPDAESDSTFSVGYWSRTAPSPATRPRLEVEAAVPGALRRGLKPVGAASEKIPLLNDVRPGIIHGVDSTGEIIRRVRIR